MTAATGSKTEEKVTPGNGSKDKAEAVLDTDAERKRLDAEAKKEGGEGSGVRPSDHPDRVLARRAVEIAESAGAALGSSITKPQATLIRDRLGSQAAAKFKPATQAQLLAYAQGGRGSGRSELPDEALTKLRDFCRATGSRRIWPRKVAAVVLALHEEKTGSKIPGTTKKEEAKKAS